MKLMKRILAAAISAAMLMSTLPSAVFAQEQEQQQSPSLSALSLDGNYTLNFSPEKKEYTVFIPQGHPRVPRISATAANNASVKVYNAAIPVDKEYGYGYVVVSADGKTTQYSVKFVKKQEAGFVLQYDDRYTFKPEGLSGDVTFSSSDSDIASVDQNGVVRIRKASNKEVVITAQDANGAEDTLEITRTDKAQVDIIMSVGQSNAYGTGGDANTAVKILPGTGYDMGYNGDTQADNYNKYPQPLGNTDNGGTPVSGVRQAFTKNWYALTGEKTLFINAADPGTKIENWQENGPVYKGAKKEYLRVKALIANSDNFETYRTFYYFNHGSADVGDLFNPNYYQMLVNTTTLLRNECDMEFGSIFEYFATNTTYTSYARAAQNRLSYTYDDIYIGAVVKEEIQQDRSLINSDDLHISQKGHDRVGELLARGTYEQALFPNGKVNQSSKTLTPKSQPVATVQQPDANSYVDIEPMTIGNSKDWLLEFKIKLNAGATRFTILKGDGYEVYVDAATTSTSKVRGIGITTPSGTVTLSACDPSDFYSDNTWRIYYDASLNLVYLYKNNIEQSKDVLEKSLNITGFSQNNASAVGTLYYAKLFEGEATDQTDTFDFESNFGNSTGNASISLAKEEKALYFEKATFTLNSPITLSADKDWTFEFAGKAPNDTALMGTNPNTQCFYANHTEKAIRVRYSPNGFVDMNFTSASDIDVYHVWKLEYTASENKLRLYKDGVKTDEENFNQNLSFTQMGMTGGLAGENKAEIDYYYFSQEGINKGTGNEIKFEFDGSLTDESGNYTFTLASGVKIYKNGKVEGAVDGKLHFANSTYFLSQNINLSKDKDWRIQFSIEGVTTDFALLGTSPDNVKCIYFNRGESVIRVRYSTSAKADLSVNFADFEKPHDWIISYSSADKKLTLMKDNAFVSEVAFDADMYFQQLGSTAQLTKENQARLYYLDINQEGISNDDHILFDFDDPSYWNWDANKKISLTLEDGIPYPYLSSGKMLSFNGNNFALADSKSISLSKDKDWSFEIFSGGITNDFALLGTSPVNVNCIYVNQGEGSIRVRYSTSAYVALYFTKGDFANPHTWRIEYKAATHKISLYRDGVVVDTKDFNAALSLTQMGMTADLAGTNNGYIDYMVISQEGINDGTGNEIRFDFNGTLSDVSGNYTFNLMRGNTTYINAEMGMQVEDSVSFIVNNSTPLDKDSNWAINFKAEFDPSKTTYLFGDEIVVDEDGFTVGGELLEVDQALLEGVNRWTIVNNEGTLSLYRNYVQVDTQADAPDSVTIDKIGGNGSYKLYSLSISKFFDVPPRLSANISGTLKVGSTVEASLTSPFWNLDSTDLRYSWMRDGMPIGMAQGKTYTLQAADLGSEISCRISLPGSNEFVVVKASGTVEAPATPAPEDENDSEIPQTVKTVVATPDSSALRLGDTITLSCETENATIKYSVDGGKTWQTYSAPITVEQLPLTLMTYAVAENMFDSPTVTYEYTQIPKVSAVTANPPAGEVDLNTSVTLTTATSGATIKYSTDNGTTWNDYTQPIVITSLPFTIKAYAVYEGYDDSDVSTFTYVEKAPLRNGWFTGENGKKYYYKDGKLVKNSWVTDKSGKYRTDANGAMITNKVVKVGSAYYAFNKNGLVQTGTKFVTVNNKKYFVKSDKVVVGKIFTYKKAKYIADKNGVVQTGTKFVKFKDKKYFIKSDKVVVEKKFTYKGKTYLADKNGVVQTGTRLATVKNKTYALKNGLVQKNKWVKIKGKYYRTKSDGTIYKGTSKTIGGKKYKFAKNGVCLNK